MKGPVNFIFHKIRILHFDNKLAGGAFLKSFSLLLVLFNESRKKIWGFDEHA